MFHIIEREDYSLFESNKDKKVLEDILVDINVVGYTDNNTLKPSKYYITTDKKYQTRLESTSVNGEKYKELRKLRFELMREADYQGMEFITYLNTQIGKHPKLQGSMTQNEIAVIMGISKQRVAQIEKQALKKLLRPQTSRRLKQYFYNDNTAYTSDF